MDKGSSRCMQITQFGPRPLSANSFARSPRHEPLIYGRENFNAPALGLLRIRTLFHLMHSNPINLL